MKLVAIVVTYEGIQWIDSCLQSLLKSTFPVEILVVDNNSSDGTPDKIRSDYPMVELVKNASNLGFGQANNIGFRKALDARADYLFLLNQDAHMEPNTLKVLIEQAEQNPDYGLLAPIQLNGDGSALDQEFASHMMQGKYPRFYSDLYTKRNKLKGIYQVEFIPAAAWLLSVNTLKTIGGFDPMFRHYGEDDNYLQRLKYHGIKIGICSECRIFHDKVFKTDEQISKRLQSLVNFEKELKVRYGDVNTKRNLFKYWGNTFLQSLRFLLSLKLDLFAKNIKRQRIICSSYIKIKRSRKTNQQLGMHYIPVS